MVQREFHLFIFFVSSDGQFECVKRIDNFCYGFGKNVVDARQGRRHTESTWIDESRCTIHNGLGKDYAWLQIWFEYRANHSFVFQLGTSPLHLAAMHNHLETCEVLLRAGISKDARTKVDRTPLHLAVYEGHEAIVELLLRNKCDVNAKDMVSICSTFCTRGYIYRPAKRYILFQKDNACRKQYCEAE